MGREVRRVPADWQHPKDERTGKYLPLYPGERYEESKKDWEEKFAAEGMQAALDWCGNPPSLEDYMPNWPEAERTHYMMYEDTSEGTPLSPAFATPEELARWCADNGASIFGHDTANYETWLRIAGGATAIGLEVSASGCRPCIVGGPRPSQGHSEAK